VPVTIARRTDDVIYADITIEKDRALHLGFQDQTAAQHWASKIARKIQNHQRHLVDITGIPHAFVMPEKCFTEDA